MSNIPERFHAKKCRFLYEGEIVLYLPYTSGAKVIQLARVHMNVEHDIRKPPAAWFISFCRNKDIPLALNFDKTHLEGIIRTRFSEPKLYDDEMVCLETGLFIRVMLLLPRRKQLV